MRLPCVRPLFLAFGLFGCVSLFGLVCLSLLVSDARRVLASSPVLACLCVSSPSKASASYTTLKAHSGAPGMCQPQRVWPDLRLHPLLFGRPPCQCDPSFAPFSNLLGGIGHICCLGALGHRCPFRPLVFFNFQNLPYSLKGPPEYFKEGPKTRFLSSFAPPRVAKGHSKVFLSLCSRVFRWLWLHGKGP